MVQRVLIDLFCGAGGFSEGALRAGYDHVIAVDCWHEVLQVHAALHPTKVTVLEMELGKNMKTTYERIMRAVPQKFRNARFHCHASPPCQNISLANNKRNLDDGLTLVRWSVRFIELYLRNFTWTLEQVYHPVVYDLLIRHTPHVNVVNMADYGVPQARKRLFASNVDFFRFLRPSFTPIDRVITVPKGTAYLGNGFCNPKKLEDPEIRHKNIKAYVRGSTVAYTVTSNYFNFINNRYKRIRTMTCKERALLQTFNANQVPVFERLSISLANKLLGNSVPPHFAMQVMRIM